MAEANVGTQIQGEGGSSSLSPEISREQAIENRARSGGWRPETEWDGDPADWVSAGEFVRRGELFDKIKELKTSLHHTRQTMQNDMKLISNHFATVREQEYNRAMAELKAARRNAMQENDVEAVEAIEQRMDKEKETFAKQQQQTQQQGDQGPSPEFQEWVKENSWYQSDTEMQADANQFAIGYAATHPNTPQGKLLEEVEKRIKKLYPEKFKRASPPAGMGSEGPSGESKATTGGRSRLTEKDLTFEEQKVMHALLNRGVLKDVAAKNKRSEKDEYLHQLAMQRRA